MSISFLIETLDKSSYTPLYYQLYERMVEEIEAGHLKAGDRLPSERELAEQLKVSRITARQALAELVEAGLIYREQGRGTFVAEPKLHGLLSFTSFTQDLIARGHQPSSRVIVQKRIQADPALQKVLKLPPGGEAIHIDRVRLADDQPVAFQTSYLPYNLCPGLENEDISNTSLFEILHSRYKVNPAWTEPEIEAIAATKEQAELLEIKPGSPLLVVRAVTYSDTFEIVESVLTIYRSKGIKLYLGRQRLTR